MRIEATQDGPGMFEIDTSAVAVAAKAASQSPAPAGELLPEVLAVKVALQRLASQSGAKATLEACRIFRVLGMRKFHAALRSASQGDTDLFAQRLDAAAGSFTAKQQEQITAWTGLTMTTPPAEDDEDEAVPPEEPPTRRSFVKAEVKQEMYEARPAARRPDWTGRAAPNTPADGGRTRYGSQPGLVQYRASMGYAGGKKGGKKGNGKGPRSYGIASLGESARLHGSRGQEGYDYGQLSAMPDARMRVGSVKQEEEGPADAKRRALPVGGALKRPKGTPTVAPLCPAQCEDDAEVWEDL